MLGTVVYVCYFYLELFSGWGRPSFCFSVLNFAAFITTPSNNRRYHDFSETSFTAFPCVGLGGWEGVTSGMAAVDASALGKFASNDVPVSWAWLRDAVVKMTVPNNIISMYVFFSSILFPVHRIDKTC